MTALILRKFRDVRDYYHIAQIHWESCNHDKLDPLSTLDPIPTPQDLELIINKDHCNLQKDIVIVEINNEVIGYSYTQWWNERGGTRLFSHFPYIKPRFRDDNIFDQLIIWAESNIQDKVINQTNKIHTVFASYASDGEKEKQKALMRHHYEATTILSEMIFTDFETLPRIRLNHKFILRSVTPSDFLPIYKLNMNAYAYRKMTRAPNQYSYKYFLENAQKNFPLWYIVLYQNKIISFILTKINKGRGEIMDLTTEEAFRKQGLATALVSKGLRTLQKKGIKEIRLHTLDNQSKSIKKFYEKIGFQHYKNHIRYRKSFT